MQVIQAGSQKLLLLELDNEIINDITKQLGFQCRIQESRRALTLDLVAADRQSPLLLFDAADPGNLGWFSRCQFYVDATTAAVLQTPFTIANQKDHAGYVIPNAVRVQINRELPETFRMPAKQPVNEQIVYNVLFNFLSALLQNGVALCGSGIVKPLAGRGDSSAPRG
ncbi:MAG: hypothetical protein FJW20_15005 [Acidimicrobiia bacterium]|nr:hypothetical protein [Acidimicrobiia bacterium]